MYAEAAENSQVAHQMGNATKDVPPPLEPNDKMQLELDAANYNFKKYCLSQAISNAPGWNTTKPLETFVHCAIAFFNGS